MTELAAHSGLEHSTISRWVSSSEERQRVLVRSDPARVDAFFSLINTRDKARGGSGEYAPSLFGFRWSKAAQRALLESDSELGRRVKQLTARVYAYSEERAQYAALAKEGSSVASELDRAAWDIVWRRYCRECFPSEPKAHLHPPKGVDWYPR